MHSSRRVQSLAVATAQLVGVASQSLLLAYVQQLGLGLGYETY